MKCAVFAGQGAQTVGMGRDFAVADRDVAFLFEKASKTLGFDIAEICFAGPIEELTKSNVCQPAIFLVSYAAYMMLQKKSGVEFGCAAGLSLGEWGALTVAGVVDVEDTLKVLEARGRFMQEACEAVPSGMIAIVGASAAQLDELCAKTGCTVANVNSSAQVVLSGSKDEIAAAALEAKALGIKRAIPLATAGAFHSKFMASAREKLAPVLQEIEFKPPRIPVLSNVTGKVHPSDGAAIRELMLRQVTEPTNWAADVLAAKELGADTFVEFGPGKVLSGLVKKIDASLAVFNVADEASLEATAEGLKG
ncbi:MAG: ACP S-malonyltransferase [Kiritimatiellae bacterium]|nr:ACP S-malonyltransferase [Kiritimatiellia bacterium]